MKIAPKGLVDRLDVVSEREESERPQGMDEKAAIAWIEAVEGKQESCVETW